MLLQTALHLTYQDFIARAGQIGHYHDAVKAGIGEGRQQQSLETAKVGAQHFAHHLVLRTTSQALLDHLSQRIVGKLGGLGGTQRPLRTRRFGNKRK